MGKEKATCCKRVSYMPFLDELGQIVLNQSNISNAALNQNSASNNLALANTPYSKMAAILVFICFHAN